MRPLTTVDLKAALSANEMTQDSFDGVFALDEIVHISKKPRLILVNTDPSWKRGQHWLVIFFSSRGKKAELFDSLGSENRKYPREIMQFIWRFASSVKLSKKMVQPPETVLCGLYCLYYAACRCSKIRMVTIVENMPSAEWIKACIPLYFGLV